MADLAVAAPARYAAAHLPPVVEAKPTASARRGWPTQTSGAPISVPLGSRRHRWPAGSGTSGHRWDRRAGDDLVAQAFAGAVLEHALGSDDVHAADIAGLLESTGVVVVPRAARHLVTRPHCHP